jgi:polysaccharide export outer membrane protein
MKVLVRISVTCAAFAFASCSYGPDGGRIGEAGQVQVVASAALPEPGVGDGLREVRQFLIGPQDVLIIDVLGVEEMTDREIAVDAAGYISIPLAGSVQAAGNTPDGLARLIEARLREKFMRDPHVSVNVKDAVSQFVTVEGQVMEPGNYPVLGDMTLMRAVASAKGLGEFAKQDDVVVLRTVAGQRYAGVYNLAAIRRGNYPDPEVYANDVVIVGNSATLRRMKDFITILPALTSPLIYLLGNNN